MPAHFAAHPARTLGDRDLCLEALDDGTRAPPNHPHPHHPYHTTPQHRDGITRTRARIDSNPNSTGGAPDNARERRVIVVGGRRAPPRTVFDAAAPVDSSVRPCLSCFASQQLTNT